MDKNAELWFQNNTFHHSKFSDISRLVELKKKKGVKISLAFPTRNEEKTISQEITVIKGELMDKFPLLDEIAVLDSGSTDRTMDMAKAAGAQAYLADEILPSYSSFAGKGENLWKSLYVLTGDIIVWIDADIKNIHPKFAYGVIGPLLEDETIGYVKAFYERPLKVGMRTKPTGGGRVTEILVRPLLANFYPELSLFMQPISGEYAGRRSILEEIPFRVGYGVDIGQLLDIYDKYGLSVFAQVDMDRRLHRNQSLPALGNMSFGILHTFITKLRQKGEIKLERDLYDRVYHLKLKEYRHILKEDELRFYERPPMTTIKEYRQKRPASATGAL